MKTRPSRQSVITTKSVPAPVGGLNALNSIADMPPTDALVMDNWFPTPSGISVRGGSLDWSTGMSGPVETIMTYNGSTGAKMFAAAGGIIYDITTAGSAAASIVQGQASNRWSYANFGTAGAQYLLAVNGVDLGRIWNGFQWQLYNSGLGLNIASITASGSTATLTTTGLHGLATGVTVTISGAVPAAYNGVYQITVTGPTTFQYALQSLPGGNATTVGSLAVTPGIQGIASNLLTYVTSFKSRLYFVEKNSFRVWYLPVGQAGGNAVVFDMSSVFKLGGNLVCMQSWNIDTVAGPNDYFAFFSNKGEVVVYNGFDPSQTATWGLVGAFRIGRLAAGNRSVTKVGSDLYCITVDGVVPLSKAMLVDRSQGNFAVSAKIDNLLNTDVATYNGFGWQIVLYPVGNKILINVPFVENTSQYQYVCNTITGSWCIFRNWNANCWEIMNDMLFYGTTGKVVRADVGFTDNGVGIITDLKPAFSAFDAPGANKQFTMARPIFQGSGVVGISAVLNVDFRDAQPSSALNLPPQANVSFWNVAMWNVSYWSIDGQININWQSVAGIGYQASYRMKTISKTECSLLALDYGYQIGGIY